MSVSRHASCSAEDVLGHLRDPGSWARWQPEIITAGGPSPLQEGDSAEGRASLLGFVVEGRSSTVVSDGTTFEEDVIVGVRMKIRYELKEVPDGVVVTRRLTTSLPSGVSGRVLSFFLKRRLAKMQQTVLDELVTQSEAS
jgi:hypothetical protein